MSNTHQYFTPKFFERHVINEEEIHNIVNMNTPDGQNGTRNELKETGLRLCKDIANIPGLPDTFVNSVNGMMSIRTVAFSENYVGHLGIDRTHRVVVCNALNEIKVLLTAFRAEPEKYSWDDVSTQTMGYPEALGNCSGGREHALKTLVNQLKDHKVTKELLAKNVEDPAKAAEETKIRTYIQVAKEKLIAIKINSMFANNFQSVHLNKRVKYLVCGKYGLTDTENDTFFGSVPFRAECNQLEKYVYSNKFLEDFMNTIASSIPLHPVTHGESLFKSSRDKIINEILKPNGIDEEFIYSDGNVQNWNANMNHMIKLHFIKQMLPLGIFTEEITKKLAPLTNPSVMKLVAVLGQNIQSETEREGFVENQISYEYEKPDSAHRLGDFYSYDAFLGNLRAAVDSGKCEHFKEQYVQDCLKQVDAEEKMKLHIVNIDSYKITRLAHMIVKNERNNTNFEYRDELSEKPSENRHALFDIPSVKAKLLEIAKEVKRIEEKNGFTRTLEQCFYAVYDFFRCILGYEDISKYCEAFLYKAEVTEVENQKVDKQSFVELVGYVPSDQTLQV